MTPIKRWVHLAQREIFFIKENDPIYKSCFNLLNGQIEMNTENRIFSRIRKGSKSDELSEFLLNNSELLEEKSEPARSLITFGNLAKGKMGIRFQCMECGHIDEISSEELIELFDEDWPMKGLRKTCRCGCSAVSVIPFSE